MGAHLLVRHSLINTLQVVTCISYFQKLHEILTTHLALLDCACVTRYRKSPSRHMHACVHVGVHSSFGTNLK